MNFIPAKNLFYFSTELGSHVTEVHRFLTVTHLIDSTSEQFKVKSVIKSSVKQQIQPLKKELKTPVELVQFFD